MDKAELFEFCRKWLDAWTGNQPEALLEYYTDDAVYIDPANRDGLKGKDAIRRYFVKLLDVYRDWVWKPIDVFPTDRGMVVKWDCTIPIGTRIIDETGMDLIELEDGKISRNEVYFDRTRLVEALNEYRGHLHILH
ncbi:MAG: nuclear transport factor 2 family protein [Candidatus Thorarchaeota archaeon]